MAQTGALGGVYRGLCNLLSNEIKFDPLYVSESLGFSMERLGVFLDLLEEEGSLSRDPSSGQILACHPFSVIKTPYIVQTLEWSRYANSALEALSISYLLNEPVSISSICPCNNEMLLLDLRGREIRFVDPASLCILEKEPDCGSPFKFPGISETIFFCDRRRIGTVREKRNLQVRKIVDVAGALQSLPDRLKAFPWAIYLRK